MKINYRNLNDKIYVMVTNIIIINIIIIIIINVLWAG